jgi:hypothetical protein
VTHIGTHRANTRAAKQVPGEKINWQVEKARGDGGMPAMTG